MTTLPEVQLKNIVDYCLDWMSEDYHSKTDKTLTYLYKIFGTLKTGSYDYFENAVAILTKKDDNPRSIETHFFLNPNRFSLPTIHISLPSETVGPHGTGFDTHPIFPGGDLTSNTISERDFNARYNLVFTSDNTFEVLIMYNAIRFCLIGNVHLLEFNGIRNPSLSGSDILLNQELNPITYARALQIDCFYEVEAFSFKEYDIINKINFEGKLNE